MFIPLREKPSSNSRPDTSQISQSDWNVLADFWYPVALADSVRDKPVAATLLDVNLVLYRGSDQSIAVASDICPHRFIRLSAGKMIDGQIECAFHGLRFDTQGQCRLIPALGSAPKLPAHYRLRTFSARERYGLIWACLGDQSKHDIPAFPDIADTPVSDLVFVPPRVWPVSAPRQVENFVDLAHLPFIHPNSIGGDPTRPVSPGEIELLPGEVILRADYLETPMGGEPRPCKFIYRIILPFTIDFTVRDLSEHAMYSYNIPTPISAHESMVYTIFKRSAASESGEAPDFVGISMAANQEDINVLSNLASAQLPLDAHHEIHLPVDNICNAYRSGLRELGLGN